MADRSNARRPRAVATGMKRSISRSVPFVATALLLSAVAYGAAEKKPLVTVTPKNATGIYGLNETIQWTIERKDTTDVPEKAQYVVKSNFTGELKKGELDFTNGPATVETSFGEPGAVEVQIQLKDDKAWTTIAGALVDPKNIKPDTPPPEDFDAFWKAKLEALNAIPLNPKVEPGDSEKDGIEYEKVTLDNINGTHVYGQLAKPKKEGKFPALLMLQYAGVYGLPKTNVTNRAAMGYLALNVIAHDIPLDEKPEFYKQQNEGPLKGYISFGADDKEKSYFLRMYLGDVQAVRYLQSRPDWDGKVLILNGGSQGGQQSLAVAGLCPDVVTGMVVQVPAGCDVTAPLHGRLAGFPYWAGWKEPDKTRIEVGRYFDGMNFAYHIKCPALVGFGLLDETSPATGVMSAINVMQGPVEAYPMLNSPHQNVGNSQNEFGKYAETILKAGVTGKPLPVKATNR